MAQRFSSEADPQTFTTRKHQQEARERGQFTDTHDIGRAPKDFDVLISDVKNNTLATKIIQDLGIPYFSEVTESQAKEEIEKHRLYLCPERGSLGLFHCIRRCPHDLSFRSGES